MAKKGGLKWDVDSEAVCTATFFRTAENTIGNAAYATCQRLIWWI